MAGATALVKIPASAVASMPTRAASAWSPRISVSASAVASASFSCPSIALPEGSVIVEEAATSAPMPSRACSNPLVAVNPSVRKARAAWIAS